MGAEFLQTAFDGAGVKRGASCFDPALRGLRGDRMLNYVWINKQRDPEPSCTDALSTVPLHYLDKAFENARRHPDTMVNVWLDYRLLNGTSRLMAEAHVYYQAPPNLVLRDLNAIPRYAAHPVLANPAENFARIWDRVDLARFIALNHCLSESDVEEVFYADFDIDDVALDGARTKDVLREKGLALGAVEYDDIESMKFPGKTQRPRQLTPGFIAINRSFHDYLDNNLIPDLEEGLKRKYVYGGMTFSLLRRDLGKAGAEHCRGTFHAQEVYKSYMTDVMTPVVGTVMERPALYAELGLCGLRFRG